MPDPHTHTAHTTHTTHTAPLPQPAPASRPEADAPRDRTWTPPEPYDLHRSVSVLGRGPYDPAFRAERPQKGRYRQFYQLDLEAIGSQDPQIDAETIAIAWNWYQGLGLRQVRLLLNSLGCRECRPAYRTRLQEFLRGLDLDEATRARVEINPLRVLDDKRPEVKAQLTDAPLMADHLCAACKAHHDKVRSLLADVGIAWTDEPRLVRGLDYYTRTTYEFEHPLLGAQSGIGGGADDPDRDLAAIGDQHLADVHSVLLDRRTPIDGDRGARGGV